MVIFQRVKMSPAFAKLCDALKTLGKWLVYEIDDDLMHLPPQSRFVRAAPGDYAQRIRDAMAACDTVQCSTHNLGQVLSQTPAEVAVFENQLEQAPPLAEKPRGRRPLVIAYAAGEDHWLDWLTIKNEFNKTVAVLERHGLALQVWILGDRAIFDSVETANKQFFPLAPHNEYLRILSQLDISIIPLADNQFNRCKSDVKFLESAAAGCAVIASELVYAESIEHGRTGMLFANSEQFSSLLENLAVNPEKVRSLTQNAHRYVASQRLIQQHIHKWEATYFRWNEKRLCHAC